MGPMLIIIGRVVVPTLVVVVLAIDLTGIAERFGPLVGMVSFTTIRTLNRSARIDTTLGPAPAAGIVFMPHKDHPKPILRRVVPRARPESAW